MTDLDTSETLPSVYSDFTDENFQSELNRVLAATAIEREWMESLGQATFADDYEIRQAVRDQKLTRVSWGVGFVTIPKLFNWSIERSDPAHEFHYSPPYVRPEVAAVIGIVGLTWAQRFERSREFTLSITSLIRSEAYQTRLASQQNKVTVPRAVGDSSHMYGWAFDIDGCGLYRLSEMETFEPVHPRVPEKYSEFRSYIDTSREVLVEVLQDLQRCGTVNVVEELPGTQEHSFHVCVRP